MGLGRNPHVAKAEAAEQKAREASDDAAYELAWREAARFWERAAEREKDEKRRKLYAEKADSARACADEPRELSEVPVDEDPELRALELEGEETRPMATFDPKLLN
jgi:hypothetical protein